LEPTLWLVFGSVLLAVILTIPLASLAARQRGRLAFLAGLILAPLLYTVFFHHPDVTLSTSTPGLLLAGFLVGVGTRLGSGCTSGHGVCGLSRFSIRSLVVTLVFMVVGFATATLIGYFQW
ncbi:MAG: YeeE/YedE thiosulfate transporter family protein, partial [Dickeya sp.]